MGDDGDQPGFGMIAGNVLQSSLNAMAHVGAGLGTGRIDVTVGGSPQIAIANGFAFEQAEGSFTPLGALDRPQATGSGDRAGSLQGTRQVGTDQNINRRLERGEPVGQQSRLTHACQVQRCRLMALQDAGKVRFGLAVS